MDRLEQLTFYDVLMAVTAMDLGDLQENPFLSPSDGRSVESLKLELLIDENGADIPGQKLSANCSATLTQTTDCLNRRGTFRCRSLPQPNSTGLAPCTPASSFSYFSGSEVSFVMCVIVECLVVIGRIAENQ